MAKVRIICNPYEKKTEFKYWRQKNETWESVAPDNALREKSITNGFFPFKAEDIVKKAQNIRLDTYYFLCGKEDNK